MVEVGASNNLKVLSIGNSEGDALLIEQALKRGGFTVDLERVSSLEALRQALANQTWDVVISDDSLPQCEVMTILEIVQKSPNDLPFIIVARKVGETSAVELMKAGAHDYLMKDNLARLPEVVKRELRDVQLRAERQRSQLELDFTKERLQLAIEGSGIGLWDWSIQTGEITINDQWAEMIGYRLSELEPICFETWSEHLHPDDFQKATVMLKKHLQGEISAYECELRMRHKSGDWVWVLCKGRIVAWDQDARPLRMIGTHLDINERKQANQALEQLNRELEDRVERRTKALQQSETQLQSSEERSHAMLVAIPDLVFRVSRHGNYLDFKQPIQEEYCVDPQLVIGKNIYDPYPIDISEEHAALKHAAIEKALSTKNVQIYEQYIRLGGKFRYEEVRVSPCGNDEVVFFVRDISDRKLAEAQLQQTNQELARATRLKDEFLANMSHELRTPLNAILGMAEGLQDQVFGTVNERQIKAIQTIRSSGTHLLELINDILDVSKIVAGQIEINRIPTAIPQLCQSSLGFVKQQALRKQIQIYTKMPLDLPDIWIDERRIRQVLINLLNNAVKFTPAGGSVTLDVTYCPADRSGQSQGNNAIANLQISVIDTGIGIAAENIPKLFKPFVQIDSALNRQYAGTGLGLTLVKQMIEIHGGNVSLTSELGKGSCFTITLPYISGVEQPTSSHHSITPVESPPQFTDIDRLNAPVILLVEDNEANVLTVSSYLTERGYQILIAKNGQEAIAMAQAMQPHLIVMDVQMPIMDGLEATKQIRQIPHLINIPIIALTALAMPEDHERCIQAGANSYLVKPVSLSQLINTMRQLLSR
ncbi:response regulator [Pseudanabaena mucicola]|uniref:histidine kinase n=1 Tax=Pseudanabaena mucicola FACHB-723 TaxID=2692860 RepID=A0ABR7ZUJ5_9CYAN|nr:response regulator [Pseudanabaena mucicola]MBD2186946.1 response regulator [Pseudanabaena mucicola FACHB-723]